MRPINLVVLLIVVRLAPVSADDKACLGCHPTMQALLSKADAHPAMAMGCGTCHVDHTQFAAAMPRAHHLKATIANLCVTCHAEVVKKEYVHEPVKKDCTLCHNPHDAVRDGLRAQSNALCVECHSDAFKPRFETNGPVKLFNGQVTVPANYFQNLQLLSLPNDRGHPVSNHPVLRKADAEWPAVSCTVCHTPHGANKSASLLVTDMENFESLCQRCHK